MMVHAGILIVLSDPNKNYETHFTWTEDARNKSYQLAPSKKADDIFWTWADLYLNHPEFLAKVDAAFTKDQQKLSTEIVNKAYNCLFLRLDSNATLRAECLEKFINDYDVKELDEIIDKLIEAKNSLPSEKVRNVSAKYKAVFEFYFKLAQKMLPGVRLPTQFNQEEREFMENLVEKYNHWFFHITDISTFSDFAAFMKDREILRSVFEKIEEIEKKASSEDSVKKEKDSDKLNNKIDSNRDK